MSFSQDKKLFSTEGQDLFDDLAIKKNDQSLVHKQLFGDKANSGISYLLKDYKDIAKRNSFLQSENSAIKDVMPIYIPEGEFKGKHIFTDGTMHHFIITQPVKER